jgi:hypothetical protein
MVFVQHNNSRNRTRVVKTILVTFMIFLLLSGCSGGGQHWYNPGKTRVDFDGDSQECELIALELSRQATLTGRREDPQASALAFNNCLYAKGWGILPAMQPSPVSENAETVSSLAVYHQDGTIEAFGRSFAVPAGFALQSDSVRNSGSILMQNLLFLGPDSVYINFTLQRSLDRKFEPINYPAQEPFFLYEQGRDAKKPDRLRWAVFAGPIQENWVTGLGGYLLLGNRERLTVVITSPLSYPQEPVPAGLNLSHGQFVAVEQFRGEWLPWLKEQM